MLLPMIDAGRIGAGAHRPRANDLVLCRGACVHLVNRPPHRAASGPVFALWGVPHPVVIAFECVCRLVSPLQCAHVAPPALGALPALSVLRVFYVARAHAPVLFAPVDDD